MLKFIMKLAGWEHHPAIVFHALESCPACRALVQRKRYQQLVHTLAKELLHCLVREEILMKRVLCMRAPLDEQEADSRMRDLEAVRQ